jgi:hypothetical protein
LCPARPQREMDSLAGLLITAAGALLMLLISNWMR